MLLQAPIIGVLLAIVFGGQEKAIPAWCLGALQELGRRAGGADKSTDVIKGMEATADHTAAIFFLVVAAVWFGTSNAAREIVSERAIYLRERMVNLGLVNYVLSQVPAARRLLPRPVHGPARDRVLRPRLPRRACRRSACSSPR